MSRRSVGVVLVHGGCHGPWCWEKVVPRLYRSNIHLVVATPDLYKAEDPALPGVVQEDVNRLARIGPIIVCGHSYAGYAISALEPSAVAHLVYLAATLPDREPWWSGPLEDDHVSEMYLRNGEITVKPECARDLFYADCNPADARAAIKRLRSHPQVNPPAAIERPAWREVETTYVCCEQDNAVKPSYQLAAGERVGRLVRWPTSHSPMISRPDLVADLLTSIASRVASA